MRVVPGGLRGTLLVALALVLAGCGVRPEDGPHRLDDAAVPVAPGSPISRPVGVTVYLVRDSRVVPVRRIVVAPPTAEGRLASLSRGPDDREAALGLTTVVHDRAVSVRVRRGIAAVELSAGFAALTRPEQTLAAAQVVFTLTEAGGVRAVRFSVDGDPVAVPRAPGPPTTEPVSRADYATLGG